MTNRPERGVVGLLTAQALAFGVMLALLVVPANSLFLDTYGSKWLPVTYIAIAVFGTAASALIARAARRMRLVRVASVSLAALAVLFAASWLILQAGGLWVSALLLVLFPIALQMGFVFIGAQAGRLLDVRQLKERFPRIVTGFSSGFLLGGLLGIPLLALFGSTEDLLLATTVAQLAFLALLVATERRFPEVRTAPTASARRREVARQPARVLFASGLVLLLFTYQALSAMGTQVLDFILYNRAQVEYTGDDLTRFLSAFTAVVNLADIVFLAVLAAPLMRRFGLRLGLVLNPVVITGLLMVMAVIVAGPGAATYGLFVLAGVARTADLIFTDGTTRTSINASYQVVPMRERVAVQAVVEGIGVPVAIGVTGVVLLLINLLGLGASAVIVFGVVLSLVWSASGFAMYRSYKDALAGEMRRRSLVPQGVEVDEEDAALRQLLQSDDARDVRLGLDLLPNVASPASVDVLRQVADHANADVRMRALVQLATGGDTAAANTAAGLARELAASADPAERRAAAVALGARDVVETEGDMLLALIDDEEPTVRSEALDAVVSDDADDPAIVDRVVAAIEDPHTAGSATAAVRRLGGPAVPVLAAALSRAEPPRRTRLIRAAASVATAHGLDVIAPALHDADRVAVLTALEALCTTEARDLLPPDVLDHVFDDAAGHAARALAARGSLTADDGPLQRAIDDEIDLARGLVIAVLTVRHGDEVRNAVRVLDGADGQRGALAVEALDVILTRDEAAIALPLVRRDLAPSDQAKALAPLAPEQRAADDWIADMADDPEHAWRSHWVSASARQATATNT